MDLDYLAKLVGGVREGEIILVGGGRSQGKSYFQDVFVDGESFTPNEIDWFSVDECEEDYTTINTEYLWGYNVWKSAVSPSILMKSSSKQSRYVRVWSNN